MQCPFLLVLKYFRCLFFHPFAGFGHNFPAEYDDRRSTISNPYFTRVSERIHGGHAIGLKKLILRNPPYFKGFLDSSF